MKLSFSWRLEGHDFGEEDLRSNRLTVPQSRLIKPAVLARVREVFYAQTSNVNPLCESGDATALLKETKSRLKFHTSQIQGREVWVERSIWRFDPFQCRGEIVLSNVSSGFPLSAQPDPQHRSDVGYESKPHGMCIGEYLILVCGLLSFDVNTVLFTDLFKQYLGENYDLNNLDLVNEM
eukprot:Gb_02222 [translate_table: standard]